MVAFLWSYTHAFSSPLVFYPLSPSSPAPVCPMILFPCLPPTPCLKVKHSCYVHCLSSALRPTLFLHSLPSLLRLLFAISALTVTVEFLPLPSCCFPCLTCATWMDCHRTGHNPTLQDSGEKKRNSLAKRRLRYAERQKIMSLARQRALPGGVIASRPDPTHPSSTFAYEDPSDSLLPLSCLNDVPITTSEGRYMPTVYSNQSLPAFSLPLRFILCQPVC